MSAALIARRYADALLQAAEAAGADHDAVLAELRDWSALLAAPAAGALLSPAVKPDRRGRAVDALLARAGTGKIVAGFVKLCAAKGRLALVADIADAYARRLAERSGTIAGEAAAAHALDAALQSDIAAKLERVIRRRPRLTWREDPALLGGFVVHIGHRTWDASLKQQLQRLAESIRKGVR